LAQASVARAATNAVVFTIACTMVGATMLPLQSRNTQKPTPAAVVADRPLGA